MNEDFVPFELLCKLREKGYSCKQSIYEGHIYDVLKWLRKEMKIHIMMATYSHHPNNTHDWGYEIINLQTYTCEHYRCRFNSYEAAALAGIEYWCDNRLNLI